MLDELVGRVAELAAAGISGLPKAITPMLILRELSFSLLSPPGRR